MHSSQTKTIELRPLKDNDEDFETIEKRIRAIFRREIYLPLISLLGEHKDTLLNSVDDLLNAIKFGRIQFNRGSFSGKFKSTVSKELKKLGATWDRKTQTWKLPSSELPIEVRNAISASESVFIKKLDQIDDHLAQVLPENLASKLKISDHFDETLWKVDKDFHSSLKKITVAPQLSKEGVKRIADEWQKNTELSIKGWTEKEVAKLRKNIRESIYAGNRHESIIKIITDSHDTSINKAKFIARQETRLLLTKFKQTRYEDAGVNWYRWGISNHPIQPKGAPYIKGDVRHDHGMLKDTKWQWSNPPVTNVKTGARNNPGQDFNCRCYAVPIVTFKKENK